MNVAGAILLLIAIKFCINGCVAGAGVALLPPLRADSIKLNTLNRGEMY